MKPKTSKYYHVTSLIDTSFNHNTGEVYQKVKRLSMWYTNEEIGKKTRVRRRIARKLWQYNPLFAFKVMKEAIPDYDYNTFCRDTKPGKKKRGKIPYSAKKEWIREQVKKLDELNQRQINTLIDQMYCGPHWRIEVKTKDGIFILSFDKKIPIKVLVPFIEWVNIQRRSIKEIEDYRNKIMI